MRGALEVSGRARVWLIAASAAIPLACGDAEQPDVSAAPVTPQPLSGLYEVTGVTVDKATGAERNVAGTVIVDVEGETYTTTFDLATDIVVQGDTRRADLVGRGEGRVVDRTLDGNAQTQLIVALVPGVDPGFGMLPRHATARIVNETHATVAPDGSVRIEIDSEPAPGSEYAPTHTRLRGRRIAAKGIEGLRATR